MLGAMLGAMRSLALLWLAGAAACSDGGLALTISAADVPPGADRIEIVLASPDFAMAEGQLTGGAVRYYRQKSTAGAFDKISKLDGYVVRIEPQSGKDGQTFTPFVIAYAGAVPVAAGAVPDEQGRPLAVAVPGSSRLEATVSMVALLPADPALGVMSGQIEEVRCGDRRSGIAWQPPADLQLRLLLPDPDGAGDGGLDASGRSLDLDCDGYDADDGDCDDLRARFSPGAAEACDGQDVNCDGAHYALTQCNPPEAECGAGSTDGTQACLDAKGATPMACVGSPACRCRPGSTVSCAKCTLAVDRTASPVKPCAPAVAKLALPGCLQISPCVVEVMDYPDSDGWDIAIASGASLEFKSSATVHNGELVLRVKSDDSVAGAPGDSVGAVHLVVVTKVNDYQPIGIDLQLGAGRLEGCSGIPMLGESYLMLCSLQ